MDAIRALAARHGLVVIEDAAQAHGASATARRAGSLGDAAAFSFYPSKNLGALGDGGAICTDDARDRGARARRLRNLGQEEQGRHLEAGMQRAPRRDPGGGAADQAAPPRRSGTRPAARSPRPTASAPSATAARRWSRTLAASASTTSSRSGSPSATRCARLLAERGVGSRRPLLARGPPPAALRRAARRDRAGARQRQPAGRGRALAADVSRARPKQRCTERGRVPPRRDRGAADELLSTSTSASASRFGLIGLGYWGPNLLRVLAEMAGGRDQLDLRPRPAAPRALRPPLPGVRPDQPTSTTSSTTPSSTRS